MNDNSHITETLTPADHAAVAEAVRNTSANDMAVYPSGGSTMLDYGVKPTRPGIGLSLAKLNRVIDYPAADLTITVEAGMTIAELTKCLAAQRQRLPIDVPRPDRATVGGAVHASLWSGTPGSWVDLNPAGATSSIAYAVHAGRQAGQAAIGGETHAGEWSGTASSWIDRHPTGATLSVVRGMDAAGMAGYADFSGVRRAGAWVGSTWDDLSLALSGSWGDTQARGIWSDATTIYVVGWGFNNSTAQTEALMWTRAIRCLADLDGDGFITGDDFVLS